MQVTIEGVVASDVCGRGERHTVEWTPRLAGLVQSRVVKVVEWHHDTTEPEPEPESESESEPAPASRKRRGRRQTSE
ncbi:hypothetical protein NDR87_31440 [Nocardia sp. CDC159]|uniref:Uncharacterized protein n=1 Tax=Nocardia pulmonis TaxID=2951408 RepID=A0A9X2ECP3_9NOCA|nr:MULTISPECIES: hypothetical protein [Nocardia]MCM6777936.1 hypothetical protein [Nocardia pulmonis]MCM6790893.1 hypothetical protein [Nocardia sp. CDC159]